MKSRQQSRIPLKMAVLNLVHELMHAFGEAMIIINRLNDLVTRGSA